MPVNPNVYFIIKPTDPQWTTWLSNLSEADAAAATAAGELTAYGSRWPDTAARSVIKRSRAGRDMAGGA